VTEALDDATMDLIEEYADMIQIGARTCRNFTLLSALVVLATRAAEPGWRRRWRKWLLAA